MDVVAVEPGTKIVSLNDRAVRDLIESNSDTAAKLLYKLAQILSLRLDESFHAEAHAERKTLELGVLSPFRPRR